MGTLMFLLIVGVLFALALLAKSAWGEGLVDDAKQWWRLRSMQAAAAVALVPQFLMEWADFIGSFWPDAQAIILQLLPGSAADTLTVVGALFALARLFKQRSSDRPRWPSADDTDAAGA